jgi:lipopolysaccharide transport system permease protein
LADASADTSVASSVPPVRVYEPHRQSRLGWRVWPEMLRELLQARELLWRLIWRDVLARYKQSVFGVGIALLGPLALMGVFAFLKRSDVLPLAGDENVPYALFVYVGLLPWQMIATGLTRSTASLVQAANLVGKVQFPRETLVLAASGQAVFDLLLGLPALIVLLIVFQWPLAWTLVFVPFVLLVEFMLISGLGLILALLNAALRDVGNALPIILVVWMFLTPVFYAPAQAGNSALLNWINPASALVTAVRDLTLAGTLSQVGPFVLATLISIACWLGGWRLFHRLEPKIAERV